MYCLAFGMACTRIAVLFAGLSGWTSEFFHPYSVRLFGTHRLNEYAQAFHPRDLYARAFGQEFA